MLKIINTSDFEKIKMCMKVTKPYLYIDDEYKTNRAEWILGFSYLSTVSGPQNILPRFGTASISQINDEPYTYLSPLDLKRNNDALLTLLWRYRGKMDIYVVNCLNILLEIIVGNKFLSEYMFNSDPPTYEYARFTDWFRPYLLKELDKARRTMAYRQSTKNEESIVKCFSFLDQYDANLRQYEAALQAQSSTHAADQQHKADASLQADAQTDNHDDSQAAEDQPIACYPKRYIIGCTQRLEEIAVEERDGIIVTTHKVYTEYAESQPTLSGNKTLPSYAFYNSKLDADNYDLQYYQQLQAKHAQPDEASNQPGDAADDSEPTTGQTSAQSQTDDSSVQNTDAEGAEQPCTASEWNLPKQVGDVVILVSVNNTTTRSFNLKMKFCCDDDVSRANIRAPVNDIETLVKPYFNDMWMCVHKVHPDQDWGQFHVEWSFEEKQKEVANKNMAYGYAGRDFGDDVDDYNHVIYGPNIQMNYYSFM